MDEASVISVPPEALDLPEACPSCGAGMTKRIKKEEALPTHNFALSTVIVTYECKAQLRRSTENGLQEPKTEVIMGCPVGTEKALYQDAGAA